MESLPEELFHRLALRGSAEEYTGDRPATREALTYEARAADLSGVDLVLSHQPENWRGPAKSVQAALAAAIADTGRIRPVLETQDKSFVKGEPFRIAPPSSKGMGGISTLSGVKARAMTSRSRRPSGSTSP